MKKIYLTIATLACIQISLNAQQITAVINGNNIEANVNNGGIFFNDATGVSPGYEYPIGSGNHLIYANAFWFSAIDINGDHKLSAQLYTLGDDLFPGALTLNSATTSPAYDPTKGVYQVTASEIQDHIANYGNSGYIAPSSIADWPAHGDVSQGYDFYLAPFVDVNNDGFYTPSDGDYPNIRGDYATYMILNDKLDIHASGGEAMGIECHFMFYQYETNDFRNNTTFLNLKVINRSTQSLPEFKVGCFLDPDIGNGADDAVGCDTLNRVMFAYNFSNNDAVYGANPPAIGVVNLNQSMDVFGLFKDDVPQMNLPNTAADFYNNLDGNWKDGTSFTIGGNGYGGNTSTKYLFSGNPNNQGEWSEVEAGIAPSDRRMFMATNNGPLTYEEEICLDYAFIIGDSGDHLENVNHLLAVAAEAQNFFDAQADFVCENYEQALKVNSYEIAAPNVYPNPSNGELTVDFKGEYSVEIHGLDGRKVFEKTRLFGTEKLVTRIDSGSYILSVVQGAGRYKRVIIVE